MVGFLSGPLILKCVSAGLGGLILTMGTRGRDPRGAWELALLMRSQVFCVEAGLPLWEPLLEGMGCS